MTTIHPIRAAVRLDRLPGPPHSANASARYEPVLHRVGDEGFVCTLLQRDDPTAAAEHRIGLAAQPPLTALVLLQQRRGFLTALSAVYERDLRRAFQRVVYIREIHASSAFVADADYRCAVLDELCRRTLVTSGFVAVRPGRGVWKLDAPANPVAGPVQSETFTLCHLFGSCGFAQLCDNAALSEPVPLFLQPWSADQGLLPLRQPPTESFSKTLCVHRLCRGRMILFDKARH